ncbi:MAG: DNA mismatch endonuclease Vsr [Nitratireductor sp.]|nr:DNA mismatch endonuclease Vsr [Nitratireductor sp.]
MVDKISPSKRSLNMSAIKSTGMKPEMLVRSMVHRMGYRFRLHSKDLPGKPDLVFRSRKKVIFVHGCFWHQHRKVECLDGRQPKSNTNYWAKKLARNVERDASNKMELLALGWKVLVLWECEVLGANIALERRIRQFLEN